MEKIDIKNIIISKQGEMSNNYQKFKEIIKKNNINTILVEQGDRVNIDKDIYFDIFFPQSKFIKENMINNNSIVCKLGYKNFSMLFTGDIEEIAEQQIISNYTNNKSLHSTVLKVAHHGSKTSSNPEFLELIKPKIALIGVGKDNTFGHPNKNVIERLQNSRCKCL